MANHDSALKRVKQTEKRRLRNKAASGQMRTVIKKFRALVAEKKAEEAKTLLPSVYQVIDRTHKKGVIHANAAARYKSRLTADLVGLSEKK